jgi:cyclopropane fatty-acyl-phospholipid synthase-like methyltransferase
MTAMRGFDFQSWEDAYSGEPPPWDIGAPQPELQRLLDEGELRGDVLDVGCGTGENALLVASRGLRVLGVDRAASAIALAKAKAAERGVPAVFAVHDALDLGALRYRFTTAIDSGLFHVFDDERRKRYVYSVAAALGSGGTLHLLCFSDAEPPGPGPRRVAEWELRMAFREHFVLSRIREATYRLNVEPGGAKAWLATLTRL